MPSLDMINPDAFELQPSLVVLLWDGYSGANVLAGDVTVKIGGKSPQIVNASQSVFIFTDLANGSYTVNVSSVTDEPYYLPVAIPITLPFNRPAQTLWNPAPVWPGYPDIALADPNKLLNDPEQTPAYLAQRELTTLLPSTAYPFPAGATLVRGVVTAAGVALSGALVTTALEAQPGQLPVVVRNPDGTVSAPVNLVVVTTPVINSLAPAISAILPSTVAAGSAAFTLTVQGTGFAPAGVVQLNGAPLTTTFVNSTELQAQVTAAQVTHTGQLNVAMVNPGPPLQTSNTFSLAIANPPVITSINPSTVVAGSAAFTLLVQGSGFVSGSTVTLNGTALTSAFVNATELTAQITAAQVVAAGQPSVLVNNPGGQVSPAQTLSVTAAPAISSLNPATVTADSATFVLIVRGSGFVSGSVVELNGTALAATFVDSTQLDVRVPRSGYTTAGDGTFVLFFDDIGGRSQTVTLLVSHPSFSAPKSIDVTVLRNATVSVDIDMSS